MLYTWNLYNIMNKLNLIFLNEIKILIQNN